MKYSFIAKVFKEYHEGEEYTKGSKYLYSIQHNPMAYIHTWVIRKPKTGGEWIFFCPVPSNMDFTPRNSVRN